MGRVNRTSMVLLSCGKNPALQAEIILIAIKRHTKFAQIGRKRHISRTEHWTESQRGASHRPTIMPASIVTCLVTSFSYVTLPTRQSLQTINLFYLLISLLISTNSPVTDISKHSRPTQKNNTIHWCSNCHLQVTLTRSLAVVKRPCDCGVGQSWPNITERRYFADIIGLSSTTVT